MKCRHRLPCHSPTRVRPPLVSMVTLYCSTVLWNLEKCFISVSVSAQAAGRPLASVVSRPADALHILCRKRSLIQSRVQTRNSENADGIKFFGSTVFFSPHGCFGVRANAQPHDFYDTFTGPCMFILQLEMEILFFFTSLKAENWRQQTWV